MLVILLKRLIDEVEISRLLVPQCKQVMTTRDEYDDDDGDDLGVFQVYSLSIERTSQDGWNSPNMNINCVWDYNSKL